MVTRKLAAPSMSLVVGLVAGLAAHQAAASEELVVYGNQAALAITLEQAAIRADIDRYVSALNEELRALLGRDANSVLQPSLVLAGEENHTRG